MIITLPLGQPKKGLIQLDSNDLVFGYKFLKEPKKNKHMMLVFKVDNANGMLPSTKGVYVFDDGRGMRVINSVDSMLVSGKIYLENLSKVKKGEIVQSKGWNNQKIMLYDPENVEVIKFMGNVFGLRYSREQKIRQLNNI